jgi:hypothetical protein
VVAVVAALILAAAVVISLGRYLPQTPLGAQTTTGFQPVTTSIGVLSIGAACWVAAWTLVISGLFLARWEIRLAGVVLLAIGAAGERHEMGGDLSLFAGAAGVAAIAGILAFGLLTVGTDWWANQHKPLRTTPSRALPSIAGALAGVLVLVAYLGHASRVGGIGSASHWTVSALELLNTTAVLILPMLLIAGSDVADFSCELAEAICRSFRNLRFAAALTAGIAITALTMILLLVGPQLLLAALVTVPVLGIAILMAAQSRPLGRWKNPLPALALAGVLLWLIPAGQVALGLIGTPRSALSLPMNAVWKHKRAPIFSFRYPSTCPRPTDVKRPVGIAVVYIFSCQPMPGFTPSQSPTFSYTLISFPGGPPGACATAEGVMARNGILDAQYAPRRNDGKWRVCRFTHLHNLDIAWTWTVGRQTWLLTGQVADNEAVYQTLAPTLRQIRDSLRLSGAPGPIPPARPILKAVSGSVSIPARTVIFGLVVAVVAGLTLLLRHRRREDQVNLALLYLTCTGAWIALARVGANAVGAKPTGIALFNREVAFLAVLAALATLSYLLTVVIQFWKHSRQDKNTEQSLQLPRRLGYLIVLNVTLFLIWGTTNLYGTASHAGASRPILLGLILMLAMAWELAFSGPMLNPGDSDSPMPHRARVILYAGYLLLTTAAFLQLGTLHAIPSGADVGIFDPESIVQVGIVAFGVPLAITVFLAGWFSVPDDKGQLQSCQIPSATPVRDH